jgi:hypothetical protein
MSDTLTILGWVALISLILAIARQLSEGTEPYLLSDSWGEQYSVKGWDKGQGFVHLNERKEGFETLNPLAVPEKTIYGVLDTTGVVLPADSDLQDPRQSYALLKGVLPTKRTEGTLTAKTCYETDFLAQTEKVGNYIQRTNNYRHETPDNCSAPLTEMVDSFYKN